MRGTTKANKRLYGLFLIIGQLVLFATTGSAQTVTIPIETAGHALVLQVNNHKDLNIIYLGKKLAQKEEYGLIPNSYRQYSDYTGLYNSAYTPSGGRNLLEPAITVTHADGNNSLDLRYVSHKQTSVGEGVSLLSILLQDPVYKFDVTLYFKSYFGEDVIEQWSSVSHNEKGNVILYKYASANVCLKADSYWLRQYHGDWAKEMQPEESRITHGIKTLDSKLGTRANLFQPSCL